MVLVAPFLEVVGLFYVILVGRLIFRVFASMGSITSSSFK